MNRRTIGLLAAGSVLVVAAAGYGYLAVSTRDAPDRASLAAPSGETAGGPSSVDGAWMVASVESNFVGYRVRERLGPVAAPSDAVARTSEVTGTAVIERGELTELELTVDVASMTSDSQRRDDFVDNDALEVDEFPNATFRLTEPIPIDAPERGQVVDAEIPGDLTLHGETHEVSFAVQARWNGPTIQVAGSTTIRRADFGIDVSSRAGFSIDEKGTVEFELTFSEDGESVTSTPSTLVDNSVIPTEEGDFRPPCQSDEAITFDPQLLVNGGTPGTGGVEVVRGASDLSSLHTTSGLTGGVAWSPDGTEALYSSSAALDAPRELFIVAAEGGEPERMGDLSNVTHPDWGPDGRIVFVQWNGEDSDIWLADRDGSAARPLVETPDLDLDPRFSPDGRSVVFTTTAATDNQDVVVVDVEGGDPVVVAGGPDYEYAPSFTPDGMQVVFVRDGAIHVVGADGEGEEQLTEGPSDTNPAVSPGGSTVAFIRENSLFLTDLDGSTPRCVVTDRAIIGGPRWRP